MNLNLKSLDNVCIETILICNQSWFQELHSVYLIEKRWSWKISNLKKDYDNFHSKNLVKPKLLLLKMTQGKCKHRLRQSKMSGSYLKCVPLARWPFISLCNSQRGVVLFWGSGSPFYGYPSSLHLILALENSHRLNGGI